MRKNKGLILLTGFVSIFPITGTDCSVDGRLLEGLYMNRESVYHIIDRLMADNSLIMYDEVIGEKCG